MFFSNPVPIEQTLPSLGSDDLCHVFMMSPEPR